MNVTCQQGHRNDSGGGEIATQLTGGDLQSSPPLQFPCGLDLPLLLRVHSSARSRAPTSISWPNQWASLQGCQGSSASPKISTKRERLRLKVSHKAPTVVYTSRSPLNAAVAAS